MPRLTKKTQQQEPTQSEQPTKSQEIPEPEPKPQEIPQEPVVEPTQETFYDRLNLSYQAAESIDKELTSLFGKTKKLSAQLKKVVNISCESFDNIETELCHLSSKTKELTEQLKKIKSTYQKDFKKKDKKKISTPNTHGFNASVAISNDLAKFLGLPLGSKLRRPEVTILINKYANEKGLKNPENKGIYNVDENLQKLFGPPVYPLRSDSSQFGYDMFNLQKYMKPHFEKKSVQSV